MSGVNERIRGGVSVGEWIRIRRTQYRLSRRTVANLVGRSEEWLRLIESGKQRLDSVQVVLRLSEVLRIDDVGELIDATHPGIQLRPDATDLPQRVVQAVIDHPVLNAEEGSGSDDSVRAITVGLERCRGAWDTAPDRYTILARELPAVLSAVRLENWRFATPETRQLLMDAYQLAGDLLARCGIPDVAWIVVDRAMGLATKLEVSQGIACAAWQVARILLHTGRHAECNDLALTAVTHLSSSPPPDDDDLAVRGALLLLAAIASHARWDTPAAELSMSQADRAALTIGKDVVVRGVTFGPTAVAIARVDIALQKMDFEEALRVISAIEPGQDCPVGDRTHYYIATAYACAQIGEDSAAVLALSKAVDACPEDLRYNPHAHHAVRHLVRHDNRLIRRDVARLANIVKGDRDRTRPSPPV